MGFREESLDQRVKEEAERELNIRVVEEEEEEGKRERDSRERECYDFYLFSLYDWSRLTLVLCFALPFLSFSYF